ncbi:Fc.00g015950.m01.CDS01 [Cosmosporella sp. VM-42]
MHITSVAVAALMGIAQATNVQVVSVGMNSVDNKTDIKFFPEKITAEPGTMVQFQFWAGNHTVTQSTFDNPCIPINNVNSSIQGIYSGFQPVEASKGMGMIPVYTVMITDKKPLWMYCSKAKHCQGGMSMVINENTQANSSRSLEEYRKLAGSATEGEVVPNNASGGSGGNNGGSGDGSNGGGNDGSGSGTTAEVPIATTAEVPIATTAEPPAATTIETVIPTGVPSNATATGGDSTAPTESTVTASAAKFSISSTILLAVGAVFFFL